MARFTRTVSYEWEARDAEHAEAIWADDGPETAGTIGEGDTSDITEVNPREGE
jgi:hypothetical protein